MLSPETAVGLTSTQKHSNDMPDDLARTFLNMLSAQSHTDDSETDTSLPSEFFTCEKSVPVVSAVSPDLAAAAILLARCLSADSGLIDALSQSSPFITIKTRSAELVALVASVLRSCVLEVEQPAALTRYTSYTERQYRALLISRDGREASHKPEKGNDLVISAVLENRPVIGVSPDPQRFLPRDLVRATDFNLMLGELDNTCLALVIEAVTGALPKSTIDPTMLNAIDMNDLCLAVRKNETPEDCLERLRKIIRAKLVPVDSGPRLEDLAGYGSAKEWGLNLAADLNAYKLGALSWDSVDRGLLLDGPPGVGKTQFAKALARSAGVPLIATSVAQWNSSKYLSGTLLAIRASFDQALKLAPSILFIDELDGISDRSRLQGDYVEYWCQIVNLFLELLSGVEDRPGVVVIGATNQAEKIDPAVRRAGRLDKTIKIERPDVDDLCGILRFHLESDLAGCDLMPLALSARGHTGADVESWVRRARSHARRASRPLLIKDVRNEIRGDQPSLPDHLRRTVSIHEAGHIVVGAALGCYEPERIWLTDTGGRSILKHRNQSVTLADLEKEITMLLAGRAAESTVLGSEEVTIGAGGGDNSDLQNATDIATDIEMTFGMGCIGLVRLPTKMALYHDSTFLEAVKDRLDRCHGNAEALVLAHLPALQAIANRLDNDGYVERESLLAILSEHDLTWNDQPPQSSVADQNSDKSSSNCRSQHKVQLTSSASG
jgi:cell division protease FtsH